MSIAKQIYYSDDTVTNKIKRAMTSVSFDDTDSIVNGVLYGHFTFTDKSRLNYTMQLVEDGRVAYTIGYEGD